MTENEVRKLTPAERRALPEAVVWAAVLTTRESGRELLALEGWEFVDRDDRLKGEPDYVPDEASEVWRRQIGGRTEWCDYGPLFVIPPELPPEQRWYRSMYSFDPRLIED